MLENLTTLSIGLILYTLLGSSFILVGILLAVTSSLSVRDRLDDFIIMSSQNVSTRNRLNLSWINQIRQSVNASLASFIPEKLHLRLASANWPLTPLEFFLLKIGLSGIAFLIGWFISDYLILGIGIAIGMYLLPEVFLRRGIQRRQRQFQNQLVDVLVMIEGSLKAGLSVQQAIDVVIEDFAAPASEEFRRVRREVNLGLPFNQALINLSHRMDSDDLSFVVTAININTRVGGNLSEILSIIVDTIRERSNLFNEVRVLTSYARYAGYLLTILPFIAGVILMLLNPEFFSPILEPGLGRVFLGAAAVMVLIGNIIIRRLVKLKI